MLTDILLLQSPFIVFQKPMQMLTSLWLFGWNHCVYERALIIYVPENPQMSRPIRNRKILMPPKMAGFKPFGMPLCDIGCIKLQKR